jgi:hypothetical protein
VVQSKRVSPSGAAAAGTAAQHGKTLMIVESPTKAAKIQKFLGASYKVTTTALANGYSHWLCVPVRPGGGIAVSLPSRLNKVWMNTSPLHPSI